MNLTLLLVTHACVFVFGLMTNYLYRDPVVVEKEVEKVVEVVKESKARDKIVYRTVTKTPGKVQMVEVEKEHEVEEFVSEDEKLLFKDYTLKVRPKYLIGVSSDWSFSHYQVSLGHQLFELPLYATISYQTPNQFFFGLSYTF